VYHNSNILMWNKGVPLKDVNAYALS